MDPPHFPLGTARVHILTEKLNKFADLHPTLKRLKLTDLATTNEACGDALFALRKLQNLWALQRSVFERNVQKLTTGAVDSL